MNKNTKRLNKMMCQSRRMKESTLTIQVPDADYHSSIKKVPMHPQSFDVAVMNANNGVISANPRRNMQERVYRNFGTGDNASRTFHEPINRSQAVIHGNHDYVEYRQHTA